MGLSVPKERVRTDQRIKDACAEGTFWAWLSKKTNRTTHPGSDLREYEVRLCASGKGTGTEVPLAARAGDPEKPP